MHQKFIELDAERGTIYTEDGEMLSTSIPYFDVYMDFGAEGLRDKNGKRFREHVDSFAYSLATFFGDKSISECRENEDPTARREAHADYVYEQITTYGKDVDIVLEAKMKEKALVKYLKEFGAMAD